MKMSQRIVLGIMLALGIAAFFRLLVGGHTVALLEPRGAIAAMEHSALIRVTVIMLVLAIPMLIAIYAIAWKFRDDNRAAAYEPDMPTSAKKELLIWAIPFVFVMIAWGVVWTSTDHTDPYKPIASKHPTTTIQVVALPWKWLFIYPEQNIATVNYVTFPADAPVHFDLTADGPMSSFWIPQLGSQMYAMSAMTTQLNLIAEPGEYDGKDTEINGEGYAGMLFTAHAVTQMEFDTWVQKTRNATGTLDMQAYKELAKPSEYVAPASYSRVEPDLFTAIAMKYMLPPTQEKEEHSPTMAPMPGM